MAACSDGRFSKLPTLTNVVYALFESYLTLLQDTDRSSEADVFIVVLYLTVFGVDWKHAAAGSHWSADYKQRVAS